MSGKGSKRRPQKISDLEMEINWHRAFAASPEAALECPYCGEIELRPTDVDGVWECENCKHEAQL